MTGVVAGLFLQNTIGRLNLKCCLKLQSYCGDETIHRFGVFAIEVQLVSNFPRS